MAAAQESGASMATAIKAVIMCSIYIAMSGSLIFYNKTLLHRFPHPLELTGLHMLTSWVLSLVLYMIVPHWFPAMERLEGRKVELVKYFLPLGLLFSVALYASNKAYLYCGVAFLQFMKESNVVLAFLLSCAVGLQVMDRVRLSIVCWILLGGFMCVDGEIDFVLVGFLVQAMSQLAEVSKNVLGEYIMSGTDFKLDPMSYTMFMAPVALFFITVGIVYTWEPVILEHLEANWQLLLPNALLAYCLNVTIATVLKNCSAMGFMLAGTVKEIVLVTLSSLIFGEIITPFQYMGFTVALGGVTAWSMVKMAPKGMVYTTLAQVLCMPVDWKTHESTPLISNKESKV